MLLRFPAHQLAGLLLLYPLSLDALDYHVATTDCCDHGLRVSAHRLNGRSDDIGDEMRIHHLAVHDCIIGERSDCDSDQFWCRLRVIDDGDLYEAGSDIEPYGSLLPAK